MVNRKQMVCTIYKISNTINNKLYIGQTWFTKNVRFTQHKRDKLCIKLAHAFNKYGKENFNVEFITVAGTQECADYWELFFIKKYDTIKNGYNIKMGGSTGKHSEVSNHKNRLAHLGKKHTQISKDKVSKSLMGNKRGVGTKNHLGHKHSLETKLKLSAITKNKTWKLVDGKRVWMEK